jgi:hypothetical protein
MANVCEFMTHEFEYLAMSFDFYRYSCLQYLIKDAINVCAKL